MNAIKRVTLLLLSWTLPACGGGDGGVESITEFFTERTVHYDIYPDRFVCGNVDSDTIYVDVAFESMGCTWSCALYENGLAKVTLHVPVRNGEFVDGSEWITTAGCTP